MIHARRAFSTLAFLGSLFVIHTVQAAVFDPKLSFETIDTEHFSIHFPKNLSASAERLAAIAEQTHVVLSPKLDWKPARKTEVVLVDTTDNANGITTVLPYNDIVLFISPPRVESSLFNYDDYLTMLFTHEYTHVLHIDAYNGIATPFRWLLGKIIVPNGATPGWVREGWATYQESDKTGHGRAYSAYTDMVIRSDLLDGKFMPIDRADGVGKRWPGAETQYLYGCMFWKWLIKTYGVERVNKFHDINRSSMWLFAADPHAWKAFGKPFTQLWKEWETSLRQDLEALEQKIGTPTSTTPFVSDNQTSYFTWAKTSGDSAVYVNSVDTGRYIWIKRSGEKNQGHAHNARQLLKTRAPDKTLRGMELSGQLSLSADGSKLAYSAFQPAPHKAWSRIFLYDAKTHKSKALAATDKKALRGFDPDQSADATRLVYVCHDAEQENLCLYTVATKEVKRLLDGGPGIQFFNPRFSPNGTQIAVVKFASGQSSLGVITPADAHPSFQAFKDSSHHLLYPTWTPDGRALIYSSDESGIYNLYQLTLASHTSERITNTLTGIFQPSYSPSGELYAQVYTEQGFEIDKISQKYNGSTSERRGDARGRAPDSTEPSLQKIKLSPIPSNMQTGLEASTSGIPVGGRTPSEHSSELTLKPYTPFTSSLFVPRYLLPLWLITDTDAIFGFQTGSTDPLYRHLWNANATYRTGPGFFGFGTDYIYNRYNPILAASFYRYSVDFGDIFGVGEDFYEERWHGALGTAYTWKRNTFGGNYFFEERQAYNEQNQNTAALNLGHYAGFHFGYSYGNAKRYPASISPEKGFGTSLAFDVSDHLLGSAEKNEQRVFVGDMRYFYELPWAKHQVLALRGTGGITFGDPFVERTFALGGSLGDGLFTQTSRRTFSLRGLPFEQFSGERALVFSAEYRLPLFSAERGIGDWPIFLNRAHLGLFADYGDIFNADSGRDGEDFFDQFMLGVGAELRGDFVLGHGLPATGRLGYGILVTDRNRINGATDDTLGNDAKYGTVVLQLGTSF